MARKVYIYILNYTRKKVCIFYIKTKFQARQYAICFAFLQNLPSFKPVNPVTRHRPLCTAAQKKLRYTFYQDEDSQKDSEVGMYICDNYTYNAGETKVQMRQCIMLTFGCFFYFL